MRMRLRSRVPSSHLLHLHWGALTSSLVWVHRHRHASPVVLGWWNRRGSPRDISKPHPLALARRLVHHVPRTLHLNWPPHSCPRAGRARGPSGRPGWRVGWLLLVLLVLSTRLHSSALVLLLPLHPWPRYRHLLTLLSARELPQLALAVGKVAPIAESTPLG